MKELLITIYHDAGWANAPDDPEDPVFFLSTKDELGGKMMDVPWSLQERKAKRRNSKVASQLGALVIFTGTRTSSSQQHCREEVSCL